MGRAADWLAGSPGVGARGAGPPGPASASRGEVPLLPAVLVCPQESRGRTWRFLSASAPAPLGTRPWAVQVPPPGPLLNVL